MKLIVYHGSDKIIDSPKHNGGRKFSDFGIGFYTTTNIEMAKSWATRRNHDNFYVSKFIFDTTNLTSFTFDLDLQWLLFIAYNRRLVENIQLNELLHKNFKNMNEYDVLIGPTADDRMFDTLNLFFENNITVDHCLQSLNTMDLDIQYNIRTKKGIEALAFNKAIELDYIDKEYYANETKQKKQIMSEKMKFVRKKYGNSGKYFDELTGSDLNGILGYGL
ncbi:MULTISPECIES: DUF3990 domain-containing protein [Clostridium]|uniref:DUF3990 domain-containing protein n=1 Tax=Clostridium botulinum TaxID=1491 RepID=A0A6M0SPE2_CLOBO|nr:MULTISPECIES: DUF3990 domain-containing protein [Clostridium]MBN1038796.1 DUF3990 domain-containing protein [Clostridium botulinum]MBN1045663.1 DUF3990 domain-containing protein [Clostridium botulinum]MBN1068116.1 DUF3990 domain-containing protein [Clostridium botulinum]MBY6810198.1 DUF3990 domain-containing protein [Clostridium botulinum]MBY6823446.1 DUF3990 domain-containing protein [Clostridium botulinum]